MPSASTLTRRPAPGLFRLGFRAGRIASDKNKPAAPDVLKVKCVKNFSTPAKFGIMPVVCKKRLRIVVGRTAGKHFV
jgi:hypothetical protein